LTRAAAARNRSTALKNTKIKSINPLPVAWLYGYKTRVGGIKDLGETEG
jgi:hypothetical protein